ncbi:MAG: 50S ribosomal protein L29 [Ignavibacteria bacterium]|nr:50S ribosomal protein L29 [Ignavibacteria bacterium]
MKPHQIREMEENEIKNSLSESYESLENFRFRHATGQLENYKSLTNTRKDIARLKTIIRERELKINEKLNKKK